MTQIVVNIKDDHRLYFFLELLNTLEFIEQVDVPSESGGKKKWQEEFRNLLSQIHSRSVHHSLEEVDEDIAFALQEVKEQRL